MKQTLIRFSAGVFLISAGPALASDGAAVYAGTCARCHNKIKVESFKIKSVPALMSSALSGKGEMRPRGGNPSLSDADIQAAVVYMKSKFR